MKKVKLENLTITSFITTLSYKDSITIKGGGLTDVLPACNPNETNDCTETTVDYCASTDIPGCSNNGGSVERTCAGTAGANCPRSGANAGTVVGCTQIC